MAHQHHSLALHSVGQAAKKNSHVLYHITRAVRHNVALHHLLTPHYQPLPNLAVWTKQRLTLLSKNRWLVLFIEVKKVTFLYALYALDKACPSRHFPLSYA